MKAAHGRVFKYGDNVDTDVIIPARYLNSSDPKELAIHCMEDIDKDFVNNVKAGDIMVANKNFGCGSSREHAPIAIKAAGVSCVIAETFARIFYRNAINIGLPIIECPEAAKAINAGDEVTVDFDSGIITDETTGEKFKGQAFPPFMVSNGDIKRTRQSLFTVCTDMMETYTVAILVYGRIPDDIAVTFTSAVKIVFAFIFLHLIHMSVNHDLCIFCPVSVSSDDCTKITGSLLIILHIIISKQYIFASALCIRSKD